MDISDIATAIGTLLLAGATYDLARKTKSLVADTAVATIQADIHHRQAHGAVLTISLASRDSHFGIEMPKFVFALSGPIQNVGFGPALNSELYLVFRPTPSIELRSPPVSLGSIGVGENVNPPSSWRMEIDVSSAPRPMVDFISHTSVVLEYSNVFGGSRTITSYVIKRESSVAPEIWKETVTIPDERCASPT